MYCLNENIENLNRLYDQNSRKKYLRLDLNENPGGLPEAFVRKVLSEVTPRLLSEYPETSEFQEVLAEFLGTDSSHLCLVNGSAEGIRYVIEAFTQEGGKIAGVIPTYAMFEIYAKMYRREFVPIEYTNDLKMPVERILDKMMPDVQLLILVNPNNPVGNIYTDEEFRMILEKACENEITILVDEAYHYFYPGTFLQYALKYEHIFVTRTFSKLFSLAGVRLGLVAGWQHGIEIVQKMCTPHNINVFSILFVQKMIQEPGMIQGLIAKHKEGADYLKKKLTEHGYEFAGGAGNFVFIRQNMDAQILTERMKQEKRILIKAYEDVGGLGNCIRVSTGEKQYMEIFLHALFELDK